MTLYYSSNCGVVAGLSGPQDIRSDHQPFYSCPATTSFTITVSALPAGSSTPPTVAADFSPTSISTAGTSTLTVTFANSNGSSLTGASGSVTLPVNLSGASPGGTCANPAYNSGSRVLSFSSGTIAANSSCTLTLTASSATPSVYSIAAAASVTTTQTGSTSPSVTNTHSLTVTAAPPTVTSISPTSGTTAGGTSVTIAGTGFNGTTGAGGVRFGSNNATIYTVDSDIQITATAPAGTGTVDVTVTNNSQTSATSSADHFTYVAPAVLGVSMAHSGNATQGAAFAYTITPSTTVSATSAATVTAAFSLPAGMTYTSASGANWSCSGSGQSGSCTTTTPFGTGNGPAITLNVAVALTSPVSVNASVTLSGGGAANAPSQFDGTTVDQVAASLTITAGDNQSATVNSAFATALQVTVKDAASVVINGASVAFTAPASGASGTFATGGTNAQTVTANGSGVAAASTFTANGTPGGPYTVTATSGSATASFSLTNTATAPTATSTTTTASSVAYNSSGNSITVSGNISGTTTGYSVVSSTTSGGGTVSIDASGVATYTPLTGYRGNDTFQYVASNGGLDSATVTVTVPVGDPSFAASVPTNTGTVDTVYSQQVSITGGQSPYSSFSATGLPTNLSISASGLITGTPSSTCTCSVVVTATDSSVTGANGATASPFTAAASAFTITIGQASQSINFSTSAPAATVGGATYTPAATATSGLPVALTIDAGSTSICSISSGVVSFLAAGSCVIDANQAGNGNYFAAPQVQQTVTVTKNANVISFTAPADTALNAGPVTLGATASSGLTVTYSSNSTGVCTVAGASVTLVSVGLCSISADQAGNASYVAAATVTRTFDVTQIGNVITFTAPADTALNAGPVSLGATASSGLTVTYSSNSTGVCTVAGASVTLVSVGLCSISADQAGNASYVAAATVTRTFNVTQIGNVITFTAPADTALNAGPVSLGATASSGLTATYSSNSTGVCTVAGASVTLVSVGLCSISADQAGNASYVAAATVTRTFDVTQIGNVITFTAPADTALNAGPVSLGATASSGLTVTYSSNSTGVCTVAGASVTLVSVGLCSISADQAGNASYVAAATVTRTFNVTQIGNVITFTAPADTALNAGPVPLVAAASSGLTVTFSSNSAAICTVAGDWVSLVSTGVCSISANQPGNASYAAAPTVTRTFGVLVADTSQTTGLIDNFFATRADLILSHGPDIDRQIDRLNSVTPPSPDAVSALMGLMPLLTGPEHGASTSLEAIRQATGQTAPSPIDIWIDGSVGLFDKPGANGRFALGNLGADYLVSPDLLVGIGAEIDAVGQNETTTPGTISGTGWLAGPYLTARLADDLYVSLRAAAGRSANEISPKGTYTDHFGGTRWLVEGTLTGDWSADDWTFAPKLNVAYFEEKSDAYTDGTGTPIPSVLNGLAEVSAMPSIAHAFVLDESGTAIRVGLDLGGGFTLKNDNGQFSWDGLFDELGASTSVTLSGGAHLRASAKARGLATGGLRSVSGTLSLGAPIQ